ncbi:hypothetical protein [Anaerotruncus colihominis]|uniref:hypothetical protein n=1 Tax=Anaerotruncus colihominis TaxID=169435 RepID=UPI0013A6016C|nr:hypothetical protein [Anaerotruncus colihominis]
MEESAWIGEKIFCTARKESAGIPTDFKLFWRGPNGNFSVKACASPIDTASVDMLQNHIEPPPVRVSKKESAGRRILFYLARNE